MTSSSRSIGCEMQDTESEMDDAGQGSAEIRVEAIGAVADNVKWLLADAQKEIGELRFERTETL